MKRRQRDGLLPSQHRSDGRVAFRVGDLYTAAVGAGVAGGLRRGPKREYGYAQGVLADYRRVLESVMAFARDHGVAVPQDRDSLALHVSDRPASPKRQPLSLQACAVIAARLHVVHQTALWVMRILGLRISEAYGILVEDLRDFGPGQPGVVVIYAQVAAPSGFAIGGPAPPGRPTGSRV